jgi:hypothetical protein
MASAPTPFTPTAAASTMPAASSPTLCNASQHAAPQRAAHVPNRPEQSHPERHVKSINDIEIIAIEVNGIQMRGERRHMSTILKDMILHDEHQCDAPSFIASSQTASTPLTAAVSAPTQTSSLTSVSTVTHASQLNLKPHASSSTISIRSKPSALNDLNPAATSSTCATTSQTPIVAETQEVSIDPYVLSLSQDYSPIAYQESYIPGTTLLHSMALQDAEQEQDLFLKHQEMQHASIVTGCDEQPVVAKPQAPMQEHSMQGSTMQQLPSASGPSTMYMPQTPKTRRGKRGNKNRSNSKANVSPQQHNIVQTSSVNPSLTGWLPAHCLELQYQQQVSMQPQGMCMQHQLSQMQLV